MLSVFECGNWACLGSGGGGDWLVVPVVDTIAATLVLIVTVSFALI